MNTMKAVRFDEYGGTSVLEVRDVPDRAPEREQVRVKVAYAGINPGEAVIREGLMKEYFPARFPGEGQGSDFSGVVVEAGPGVTGVHVGQSVIGMSDERSAQAEFVTIDQDRVVPLPDGVDPAVGACLYVAGTTAWALAEAIQPRQGEVIAVSAAAGGVGFLLSQLLRRAGARVVGIASDASAQALEGIGATQVAYGDGLPERLRAAAPGGLADCFGGGYVEAAIDCGVPTERIKTIIDIAAARRFGVQMVVMAGVADPGRVVGELADLVAAGELRVPIRARYPLDQVRAAYEDLATRHGVGKIVLSVAEESADAVL
mgnify:CR=1 FL=1